MTTIMIPLSLEEPPAFQHARVREQITRERATQWTQRPTGDLNCSKSMKERARIEKTPVRIRAPKRKRGIAAKIRGSQAPSHRRQLIRIA